VVLDEVVSRNGVVEHLEPEVVRKFSKLKLRKEDLADAFRL
jgi:hypothetical protein